MNRLYIALLHYPVYNRRKEVVAAAVTNHLSVRSAAAIVPDRVTAQEPDNMTTAPGRKF